MEGSTMKSSTLVLELNRQIRALSPGQQRRLLDFAQDLGDAGSRGVPGSTLLQFAGAIEPSDLSDMARAIEEHCEEVDRDEW